MLVMENLEILFILISTNHNSNLYIYKYYEKSTFTFIEKLLNYYVF